MLVIEGIGQIFQLRAFVRRFQVCAERQNLCKRSTRPSAACPLDIIKRFVLQIAAFHRTFFMDGFQENKNMNGCPEWLGIQAQEKVRVQ